VKVFVLSWSLLVKDNNSESFWFLSIFGQGYQRWKLCFFLGHFWSQLPTVKVFVFLGHFWPRIPTVKFWLVLVIFGQGYQQWKLLFFLGHIWSRLPTVKVLVGLGHLWPRLLLLATLVMNSNDEGYVCDLRFWSTSGIPLCQTRIRFRWRQSLATHCASRSSRSGWQLLAWDCKYEYARTPVGKCWHASTSISYPGMERVKNACAVGIRYAFYSVEFSLPTLIYHCIEPNVSNGLGVLFSAFS